MDDVGRKALFEKGNLYYNLGKVDQMIKEYKRLRDHYPDLYLEWHGTSADEQLALLEDHIEELTAKIKGVLIG